MSLNRCAIIDITKTFHDKRIPCEIYTTHVLICLTLLSLDSSFYNIWKLLRHTSTTGRSERCRQRMKRELYLLVYYRIDNR